MHECSYPAGSDDPGRVDAGSTKRFEPRQPLLENFQPRFHDLDVAGGARRQPDSQAFDPLGVLDAVRLEAFR